jgi:hypothetical protein
MSAELSKFIRDLIDHELQKVELGFVAEIVDFDKTNMRAEIKPLLRSITEEDGRDNPKFLDIPNIDNVPVELIYAGGFYIRPVYKKGDQIMCACTASALETTINEGQRSNMLGDRFSLNFCRVTGSVVPDTFTAPATWATKNGLLIGKGATPVLEVADDGFKFTGDVEIEGKLEVDGDIEATGDVKAGLISLLTHTHISAAPGSPTGPPRP